MTKLVSSLFKLNVGDIIPTKRGRFIILIKTFRTRRNSYRIQGAYESTALKMLKYPRDVKGLQFVTITYKRDMSISVLGTFALANVKKLLESWTYLEDYLEVKRTNNIKKLNLKWNDAVFTKHPNGNLRGMYDVVTQKGEHVKAGDLVMVQFSNGKFEMVMGNGNGVTYDGKSGKYYCMAPWKKNVMPTVVRRVNTYGQIVNKTIKVKARSMPPETLLYLIKKTEDIR